MKIKLALVVFAALMLTSCTADNESADTSRIISTDKNFTEEGMLFSDSEGRLNFLDFQSLNTAVLCTRPNCSHTDPESCSSYGMTNHPILYNNQLFFFDTQIVQEEKDGKLVVKNVTTIYKAKPDGTERISQYVMDDLAVPNIRMALVNDTVYFSALKSEYDEYGNSTGYDDAWFCSYNLSANEFKRINTYSGYHGGTWIYGCFNSKIYFSISHSDTLIPYPADPADLNSYFQQMEEVTQEEYKVYDIESGALSDLDLPVPEYVGNGCYVYNKNGKAAIISENGEETVLEDFPIPERGNIYIYGDLMICYTNDLCYNLSKGGEVKRLNLDDNSFIEGYSNGNFIIRTEETYQKKTIDELTAQ